MKHRKKIIGLLVLSPLLYVFWPEKYQTENVVLQTEQNVNAEQVNEVIETYLQQHQYNGLNVVVADNQQPLVQYSSGWAQDNEPLTTDHKTMMASISKLFTATAIMQLDDQNLIDINKPVTDYLPQLNGRTNLATQTPTIAHLLSHHSGFQSDLFQNQVFQKDDWDYQYRSLLQNPELIYQVNEPGTVLSYSNLSYSLLANIIEVISGLSFEQYMQDNLFTPLNMPSATFMPKGNDLYAHSLGQSSEPAFIKTRDIGAGGLVSSTNDLVHFGQMVLNSGQYNDQQIISEPALKKMLSSKNKNNSVDGGLDIGLGFWLDNSGILDRNIVTYSHGGDEAPFNSFLLISPTLNITVAVNTNSDGDSMNLALLAESIANLWSQSLSNQTLSGQESPITGNDLEFAHTENQNVDGYYNLPFGYLKLQRKSENQMALESGLFNANLTAKEDGFWHLDFRLFGWLPLPVEDIKKMRIGIDEQHQPWLYIHQTNAGIINSVLPVEINEVWQNRLGTYQLKDGLNSTYETISVNYKDGHMLAGPDFGFGFNMTYVCTPINEQQLNIQGLGRNLGELIIWQDEQTLMYSGATYIKK